MKKALFIGLGMLFAVVFFISGCGNSEEATVGTPSDEMQTPLQETAPVQEFSTEAEIAPQEALPTEEEASGMMEEMVEHTEASAESTAEEVKTIADQAMDDAMQMGQESMESATQKIAEGVDQAINTAEEQVGDMAE